MRALLVGLWLPLAAVAQVQFYMYPGASSTVLWDINNDNTMLGWANYTYDGRGREGQMSAIGGCDNGLGTVFLATPEKPLAVISPPGAIATYPGGLSNAGAVLQAVGWYMDADGREHGWIYRIRNRTYQKFDVAGSIGTRLTDVNSHGDIIGYGSIGGFLYRAGRIIKLNGIPISINDNGVIVFERGWVRAADGTITRLVIPDPIALYVEVLMPSGINNAGRIVGWQRDDVPHMWITDEAGANPRMNYVNDVSGWSGYTMGINDNGRVVGYAMPAWDHGVQGFIQDTR